MGWSARRNRTFSSSPSTRRAVSISSSAILRKISSRSSGRAARGHRPPSSGVLQGCGKLLHAAPGLRARHDFSTSKLRFAVAHGAPQCVASFDEAEAFTDDFVGGTVPSGANGGVDLSFDVFGKVDSHQRQSTHQRLNTSMAGGVPVYGSTEEDRHRGPLLDPS